MGKIYPATAACETAACTPSFAASPANRSAASISSKCTVGCWPSASFVARSCAAASPTLCSRSSLTSRLTTKPGAQDKRVTLYIFSDYTTITTSRGILPGFDPVVRVVPRTRNRAAPMFRAKARPNARNCLIPRLPGPAPSMLRRERISSSRAQSISASTSTSPARIRTTRPSRPTMRGMGSIT